MNPAKRLKMIEMPFWLWTLVSPRNHILDRGPADPPWELAILRGGGKWRPTVKYREYRPFVAAMRPFVTLLFTTCYYYNRLISPEFISSFEAVRNEFVSCSDISVYNLSRGIRSVCLWRDSAPCRGVGRLLTLDARPRKAVPLSYRRPIARRWRRLGLASAGRRLRNMSPRLNNVIVKSAAAVNPREPVWLVVQSPCVRMCV